MLFQKVVFIGKNYVVFIAEMFSPVPITEL